MERLTAISQYFLDISYIANLSRDASFLSHASTICGSLQIAMNPTPWQAD